MQKPTPPPAEEPYVLFNRKRNKAEQIKYNALNQIDADEKAFNDLLAAFDREPVVILPTGLTSRLLNGYEIDMLKILHERAKVADRIFIELREGYSGDHYMTVKNTGRSAHLVANLLLIAEPSATSKAPLTVKIKPRSWEFYFVGDKGKKMLDAWLQYCRTDVRAQYALGFGPALTAPIEFDDEGNFK